MDANERRLISLEALSHFHKTLVQETELTEAVRTKLNDVAKTFAKIKKIVVKKDIKVEFEDLEVYTKKDFKKLMKEQNTAVNDGIENDEIKEVEKSEEEEKPEED